MLFTLAKFNLPWFVGSRLLVFKWLVMLVLLSKLIKLGAFL